MRRQPVSRWHASLNSPKCADSEGEPHRKPTNLGTARVRDVIEYRA